MDIRPARKHAGRNPIRLAATIIIAGIMILQPLIAADSWNRIRELKPGTWVYVHYAEDKYIEDSFLRADASGMIIRAIDRDQVKLDQDLVLQVAVMHTSRHWYSIPLAVAAGVAGGYGGKAITDRTTCYGRDCSQAKGIIIGGLAIGSGGIAYGLTRGNKTDRKVIYNKEH